MNGNVDLYAGGDVHITGSKVGANTGDVSISGENVTIDNAYNVIDNYTHTWSKSSGLYLTLGLGGHAGNIVSGIDKFDSTHRAGKAASNHEVKTLQDIMSLAWGYQTVTSSWDLGNQIARNNLNSESAGLNIGFGYGKSSQDTKSRTHAEMVLGSEITSGGDTTITARGNGQAGSGDLNIIGSTVKADGWVSLEAENDINLVSAQNRTDVSREDHSSSSKFGLNLTVGGAPKKNGLVSVGVEGEYTWADSSLAMHNTSQRETIISGGEGVKFKSGKDTTLQGAQIKGKEVIGDVGGDLTIVSEQDTAYEKFDYEGGTAGVKVGLSGGAAPGYISPNLIYQKGKGRGNYESVNEQSGIFAGEGGFDITVGGHTGLVGAVIDSDADASKNNLTTGSLSAVDIENRAEYSAKTRGFAFSGNRIVGGIPYSKEKTKETAAGLAGLDGKPLLPQSESGSSSSTTKSGIAEGTITITDANAQYDKTGQTASEAIDSLNRDTKNAHDGPLPANPATSGIVSNQLALQRLAHGAGQLINRTTGDISKRVLRQEGLSEQDKKNWSGDGVYMQVLNAAGNLLTARYGNGEVVTAALGELADQLVKGQTKNFSSDLAKQLTSDPIEQAFWRNTFQNFFNNAF